MNKKLFLIFPLLFCLFTCAEFVNENIVNCVNDKIKPTIIIESPAESTYCSKSVAVRGKVIDLASANGTRGQVTSLSYIVLSSKVEGNVEIKPDNSFYFAFSTETLLDNFILQLIAIDCGKNQSIKQCQLLKLPKKWSGEKLLTGLAKQITVGQNKDGRLELFHIGLDDHIFHNYQIQ
jgi:hypothetical protein